MIKRIELEELPLVPPIGGPVAARTVSQLTDPLKRRLVWFLQWQSHQDGGLKKFAHEFLVTYGRDRLGSDTMHRVGFNAETYFHGENFETICGELRFYPHGDPRELHHRLQVPRAIEFDEIVGDHINARDRAIISEREVRWVRECQEIERQLEPRNRRAGAATFLYECRRQAVADLVNRLALLCSSPTAEWSTAYFRDLTGALQDCLVAQEKLAGQLAAATKIGNIVEDALNYAHRARVLLVVEGTERIGKTKTAYKYGFAHPDRARIISLTADTTNVLFYREIFDALGCGEVKTGTSSELRAAIRDTLKNKDIMLVFDEAHCLFGLSQKASIKRLEYIRTEFVNRGIPVVLIITPQFSTRLQQLEETTKFNVNQFRGRIGRWVPLPKRPSAADIECLCRFCLPDLPKSFYELITAAALRGEYPFATVENVITEARQLVTSGHAGDLGIEFIKTAIGHAAFTADSIAATLPKVPTTQRRGRRVVVQAPAADTGPAGPMHDVDMVVAGRLQDRAAPRPGEDFSASPHALRTQATITL